MKDGVVAMPDVRASNSKGSEESGGSGSSSGNGNDLDFARRLRRDSGSRLGDFDFEVRESDRLRHNVALNGNTLKGLRQELE